MVTRKSMVTLVTIPVTESLYQGTDDKHIRRAIFTTSVQSNHGKINNQCIHKCRWIFISSARYFYPISTFSTDFCESPHV